MHCQGLPRSRPGAVELGCPRGVPAQACFAKQVLVLQAAPLPLSTVFPQILTSSGPFPGSHTAIPTLVPPLWKGLGSLASDSSVFEGHLFSSSSRLSGGTGGNRAASLGQTAWNSAAGSGLALPSWQRQGAGTSRVPPRLDAWGCAGCPGMLRMPRDAPAWDPQGWSGLEPKGMLRFRAGDGPDTSASPWGWSPGQDATPEAAALTTVQSQRGWGVQGHILGCQGPGPAHRRSSCHGSNALHPAQPMAWPQGGGGAAWHPPAPRGC